jgi:glycosyltransferase involved in cell wall biosynthesis
MTLVEEGAAQAGAVHRGGGPPVALRRVLLTSDFFHPTIGGAERQVQLLASALAERGHTVTVATVRQRGQSEAAFVDGVPLRRLSALSTAIPGASADADRKFLPPLPDPRLVAGLRALIDELGGVDVVHANGWIAYSSAAALEGTPVPLVLSVRDYGYSCAVRSLLHEGREICDGPAPAKCAHCAGRQYGAARGLVTVTGVATGRVLLRRHVTAIHAVSRFVETIVRRDLLDGDPGWEPVVERIDDVVPPPLGAMLDDAEQVLLWRLPSEPFILFVGQLSPHKGVDVLLRAYASLRRQHPGAIPPLVLIGTPVPGTPLDLPDGVTLLESVPHAVVMAAWDRSLFGVAPSVWPDPLPGVVREPMTRGRPVIATRVGGNTDMVSDGVNGLLVDPSDVAGLATAMWRLVEQSDLRERMGADARASVTDLTAPAIAVRFENLYAAALHTTAAGTATAPR